MNQHRLTRPHLRQLPQPEERGREAHREPGRRRVTPALRHREQQPRIGDRKGRGALGEQAHHPVADGHCCDASADLGDDARRLDTDRTVSRVDPERHHDVAEVRRDRPDGHANLAGRKGLRRDRFEHQVFEGAGF